MAQIYLTKTLFKKLGRHLPKKALAGNKDAWTPDLMARAVILIENGFKLFSTIIKNLIRFKAFIDSLELDQVDGALEPKDDISDSPESEGGPEHEGAPPEPKIDSLELDQVDAAPLSLKSTRRRYSMQLLNIKSWPQKTIKNRLVLKKKMVY